MSDDGRCSRCGRACDGCPLCCHNHPGHRMAWEPWGCRECITETGRLLASQRDDLIASGVDPAELAIPAAPSPQPEGG